MRILVTGSAGFIGNHVALRLLGDGHEVIGLDNLNAYYDVRLKTARLARIADHPAFTEARFDLEDRPRVLELFETLRPDRVVHLAAQAGVRYSLEAPQAYVDSNVTGFLNILEGCRRHRPDHLLYASSSSVYGINGKQPFSVEDRVEHPISLYGATKRANELMAHVYCHLFGIPATGLRFFTVYGPWGRPDMALFLFTRAILEGRPIDVYNHGRMKRDFTFIDDIVEGIVRLLDLPPVRGERTGPPGGPGDTEAPFRLYNIGNNSPVELGRFIEVLERKLGRTALVNLQPLQPGDVVATYAEVSDLEAAVGFRPSTSIEEGIGRFVDWYLDFYGSDLAEASTSS